MHLTVSHEVLTNSLVVARCTHTIEYITVIGGAYQGLGELKGCL